MKTSLNPGEVCTRRSRVLTRADVREPLIKHARSLRQGNPLDTDTEIGAQPSREQFEQIISYMDAGREQGAALLPGGGNAELEGPLAGDFYVQATMFKGGNSMRVFYKELLGPTQAITMFSSDEQALSIANDTEFGMGAGIWIRTSTGGITWAVGSRAGGAG